MNKKKEVSGITPLWAVRLCALAAISSMAVAAALHNQKEAKAVAVAGGAVFWGVGSGMAFHRLLNREKG